MRFFSGTAAGMATLLCLAGLTNAGVVNRAENTVTVVESATDTPTTTVVLDKDIAPSVVDRQVYGPNPTPWCCTPGCLECGAWTCWQTPCKGGRYTSCCADAFLLSKAIFVKDVNGTHGTPALEIPGVWAA